MEGFSCKVGAGWLWRWWWVDLFDGFCWENLIEGRRDGKENQNKMAKGKKKKKYMEHDKM